ncbi:hypothetical protein SAMN04488522_104460 [Pedobacter caeni]|uniref:Uncharacterized protein n=1 Tax=Pedobacter caeni TaxID=288992 RepID=A0A1M5H124_9SPHI|nr:hypothetical protein SAMN04488522_104460 [Pedobacter caeni]
MAFKARLNFTGKEYQVLYDSYSPDSGAHSLNIGISLWFCIRKPMFPTDQNFNDWPEA